jgi:secretion/DNA translocation related TadE-like protein
MNPAATPRERGQATVMTVLFMAALLGMAALVLDVGSWFREKRQLQTAADASALAGAQALPEDPGSASALAAQYAQKNFGASIAPDVSINGSTITVKTKSKAPGFFSKVFGLDFVDVGASAQARVAPPAQVQYVAPMVVSWKHPLLGGVGCPCYKQQTTLDFDPMGAPGAFGMLNLDGETGTVGTSNEAAWILKGFDQYLDLGKYRSDPGAKFSSSALQGALDDRIGTVLLFPVFRVLTGTGQNAEYDIIGWVGFHIDAYDVNGNNATLHGYFTTFIAHGIQASTGPAQPNFGVRSVQLIG